MNTARAGRRIRIAAGLGAVALTAGLAGCGAQGGGGSEGTADSGTIDWWGWTPDVNVANTYIEAFNEEYPDITVNYKQVPIEDWEAALRPALQTASGPDVFGVQPGSRVDAFKTFAEDLTPLAEEALGEDWKDKVSQIGIDGLTADDKLVAMSVGAVYAGSLWVNQALFDQAGLEHPTTLDEWVQVCEDFRAAGIGCFVQGASQEGFDQDTLQAIAERVEPGAWTEASKGERPWNDPAIVETFEIWQRLFTDGIMQEGAIGYAQYPDANNDFMSGKYAMIMMGSWYTQYAPEAGMIGAIEAAGVADPEPFPLVPIEFPDVTGEGNPAGYFGDADYGLALSTKSDNKAAARTFITWLTTNEDAQQIVANTLNNIPALKGISADWDSITLPFPDQQLTALQEYTETVSQATAARFLHLNQDEQDAILEAAVSLAEGTATPQEAADRMQETVAALGE
ncbi:ABC transporter substrate-binding protein [Naasia sp. SYSU D00948]|uniref:ABC transporter substrate-binding protein n=1 Tax=Naasia sp. SYSU D00948 TaxID=2817379 RepID=UPI001B305740|nr:ABC transporter substrate-binding protein [Naasia sp. SYSU D00948]